MLREARTLDYEVLAVDGEAGPLEAFVLDEANWPIGYLDARAGSWLDDQSLLIPTQWVEPVSWAHPRFNLRHNRAGL